MLKYTLGGIGFLVFILLVTVEAQAALAAFVRGNSEVLVDGLAFLPITFIVIALLRDVVFVIKGYRGEAFYPLYSALGGTGFLIFLMMIGEEAPRSFITMFNDFPRNIQLALMSLPIGAVSAAGILEIAMVLTKPPKVEKKRPSEDKAPA